MEGNGGEGVVVLVGLLGVDGTLGLLLLLLSLPSLYQATFSSIKSISTASVTVNCNNDSRLGSKAVVTIYSPPEWLKWLGFYYYYDRVEGLLSWNEDGKSVVVLPIFVLLLEGGEWRRVEVRLLLWLKGWMDCLFVFIKGLIFGWLGCYNFYFLL